MWTLQMFTFPPCYYSRENGWSGRDKIIHHAIQPTITGLLSETKYLAVAVWVYCLISCFVCPAQINVKGFERSHRWTSFHNTDFNSSSRLLFYLITFSNDDRFTGLNQCVGLLKSKTLCTTWLFAILYTTSMVDIYCWCVSVLLNIRLFSHTCFLISLVIWVCHRKPSVCHPKEGNGLVI